MLRSAQAWSSIFRLRGLDVASGVLASPWGRRCARHPVKDRARTGRRRKPPWHVSAPAAIYGGPLGTHRHPAPGVQADSVRSWQVASATRGGTARRSASSSTPTTCFDEITDDLLYHGDLNAALRRMMQSGFRDRNGERLAGHARDAREAAPAAPRRSSSATTSAASTTRSPRSCATSSTRSATRIDELPREAATVGDAAPPGDHRRRSSTSATCSSTCCPPDLAGQVQRAAGVRLHVGRGAASGSRS